MIDPNEKIRFVELKAYNLKWPQFYIKAADEINEQDIYTKI
jgi:hypothetical protein